MARISFEEFAALFDAVDPLAEVGEILEELKIKRKARTDMKRVADTRMAGGHVAKFREGILFPALRKRYADKTGIRLK